MPVFYSAPTWLSSPAAQRPGDWLRRRPQRITFKAHWQLLQRLQERADQEGRSLSNLIGHLLEVRPPERVILQQCIPNHLTQRDSTMRRGFS